MKILFCSRTHLSKELGASKVLVELAEEMEQLGWQCTLVSPHDIEANLNGNQDYCVHLRRYLIDHAEEYDVVEYDHGHLPYPRSDFAAKTLFVARSVLLGHHFKKISIPQDRSIKGWVRSLLFERNESARSRLRTERAEVTVKEADLINVANLDDRSELIMCGVPEHKIVVIPYGLSRARRIQFDALSDAPPREPMVVFIGTFDNRKGATDFPRIVQDISRSVPNVRFRLLGTFRDADAVRNHFPRRSRNSIEVVPTFEADALPEMLSSGSVGIFPSYVEGFGFGVLEMLAAAIPVIAYNSPGPPAMLSKDYLVAPGDWSMMSAKVIGLLKDAERLTKARQWAREQSQEFCWSTIASQTTDVYSQRCEERGSVLTFNADSGLNQQVLGSA
jgi:glycosyltransferase involved in cell wall biosynthesis